MITPTQGPISTYDFGKSISQLFSTSGGKNFAIRLILWTAAFMSIGFIVMGKAYIGMMAKVMDAGWIANQNPTDPSEILRAYSGIGQYMPMVILGSLFMWAVYAAAETALHKKIFFGTDHGFLPLRFGKDELRTMLVQFLAYLIVFGAMLAWIIVFIVGIAILGLLANIAKPLAVLVIIFAIVAYIALFVVLTIVAVRISPASALTIAQDKVSIKGALAVSKRRTGSLFLSYLFIYIIGYIAMSIVQMSVISSLFSSDAVMAIMGLSEDKPTELFAQVAEKLKNPTVIITLVIGGIVYMLAMVTWYLSIAGVGNYAVQWWKADDEVSSFE